MRLPSNVSMHMQLIEYSSTMPVVNNTTKQPSFYKIFELILIMQSVSLCKGCMPSNVCMHISSIAIIFVLCVHFPKL